MSDGVDASSRPKKGGAKPVWITLGGVALGVGGLALARSLGVFDPPRKPKRKRGSPPLPAPPDDELSDDVPLEAWEEEAEALEPVNAGIIDAPTAPHEQAIGRGHPEDHRLPSVLENPVTDVLLRQQGNPMVDVRIRRNAALPERVGKRTWMVRQENGKDAPWKVVDPLKDERFAPKPRGAPFAPIGADSTWPVITRAPGRLATSYLGNDGWHGYSGRAFNSKRATDEGEIRRHAGVDLWGREGDKVVAPESARILAILPFHHGTWAVYLITPDRRVINLGEVEKYSWREFKARPGLDVQQGQPLARIGRQTHGSTMVHYEMYDGRDADDEQLVSMIRGSQFQWLDKDNPPPRLYDPTAYLLTAASRTYRREHGAELADEQES